MVALYPPRAVAERLSLWGKPHRGRDDVPDDPYMYSPPHDEETSVAADLHSYVEPWKLHLTLLYFPDVTMEQTVAINRAVAKVAAGLPAAQGSVTGVGQFSYEDKGAPKVALIDSHDLVPLRQKLLREIESELGEEPPISLKHGFIPHITLCYSWFPDAVEVYGLTDETIAFPALSVVFGMDGERQDHPFGRTIGGVSTVKVDTSATRPNSDSGNPESVTTSDGAVLVYDSKAVWTTAYVNDLPDSAFLYVESGGEKEDGKTTPRSLRHFPVRDAEGKLDLPHLRNAIARIPQSSAPGLNKDSLQKRAQRMLSNASGDSEKAGRRMAGGMRDRLSAALGTIKEVVSWAGYEDVEEEEGEEEKDTDATKTGFVVLKTADGYRWVSISSSAFKDREEETVTTKALVEGVLRADKTGNRGPIMLWHTPGTEFGECDFQSVEGRFLIESGTFHESEFATVVRKALEQAPEPLGISIGFSHPITEPDDEGLFHNVTFRERSVCPLAVAANPFTSFETIKETQMDEQRKQWFATLVGPERAEKIISTATQKSTELEGLFSYKALEESAKEAEAAKAADATPPAPSPDPDPPPAGETPDALGEKAAEFFEAISETVNDAISPIVGAVKAQDQVLEGIVGLVKEQAEAIKTMKAELETVKTKVAEAPAPAASPRSALAHRATESTDNIISADTVKEIFAGKTSDRPAEPVNPARAYVDDLIRGAAGREG